MKVLLSICIIFAPSKTFLEHECNLDCFAYSHIIMFELGLTLEIKDFKLFRQRPYPVFAGLLGQIVLLPALAFALGYLFHLEPMFFI